MGDFLVRPAWAQSIGLKSRAQLQWQALAKGKQERHWMMKSAPLLPCRFSFVKKALMHVIEYDTIMLVLYGGVFTWEITMTI